MYLSDVDENYKVYDFWKWISRMVYGTDIDDADIKRLDHTGKYFVFDGLRYSVYDDKKSLLFYLAKINMVDTLEVQLLLSLNAGTIFKDDGIRYSKNSHEQCRHNKAHVHVDIKHQYSGTFSIIDGKQLSDGKIPDRYVKKIKKMILLRKNDLIEYWNNHTDGLDVDINQAWGLIDY